MSENKTAGGTNQKQAHRKDQSEDRSRQFNLRSGIRQKPSQLSRHAKESTLSKSLIENGISQRHLQKHDPKASGQNNNNSSQQYQFNIMQVQIIDKERRDGHQLNQGNKLIFHTDSKRLNQTAVQSQIKIMDQHEYIENLKRKKILTPYEKAVLRLPEQSTQSDPLQSTVGKAIHQLRQKSFNTYNPYYMHSYGSNHDEPLEQQDYNSQLRQQTQIQTPAKTSQIVSTQSNYNSNTHMALTNNSNKSPNLLSCNPKYQFLLRNVKKGSNRLNKSNLLQSSFIGEEQVLSLMGTKKQVKDSNYLSAEQIEEMLQFYQSKTDKKSIKQKEEAPPPIVQENQNRNVSQQADYIDQSFVKDSQKAINKSKKANGNIESREDDKSSGLKSNISYISNSPIQMLSKDHSQVLVLKPQINQSLVEDRLPEKINQHVFHQKKNSYSHKDHGRNDNIENIEYGQQIVQTEEIESQTRLNQSKSLESDTERVESHHQKALSSGSRKPIYSAYLYQRSSKNQSRQKQMIVQNMNASIQIKKYQGGQQQIMTPSSRLQYFSVNDKRLQREQIEQNLGDYSPLLIQQIHSFRKHIGDDSKGIGSLESGRKEKENLNMDLINVDYKIGNLDKYIEENNKQQMPFKFALDNQEKMILTGNFRSLKLLSNNDEESTSKLAASIIDQVEQEQKHKRDLINVLDSNKRKQIQFIAAPACSALQFQNKSEEDRYRKLATKILQLAYMNKEQLQKTYQHLIKFVKDYLSPQDFKLVTFDHLQRVVEAIISGIVAVDGNRGGSEERKNDGNNNNTMYIKEFLKRSKNITKHLMNIVLNLPLRVGEEGIEDSPKRQEYKYLNQEFRKSYQEVDVGKLYSSKLIEDKKKRDIPIEKEKLQDLLDVYLQDNNRIKTHETALPSILSKNYYQNKEHIPRPIISKLEERSKEFRGNQKAIIRDSVLRRNRLVLEHVMYERQKDVQDNRIMESINMNMREEWKRKALLKRQTNRNGIEQKTVNALSEQDM